MSLLGAASIKYIKGHPEKGMSPDTGFDCSGFVTHVLSMSGVGPGRYFDVKDNVTPIRHANEYWDHYGIAVHEGQHLPGDLVLFTRNGDFPSHIGIVINEEEYIHSPGKDREEVTIDSISSYRLNCSGAEAGRSLYTRNPIGYKSPVVAIGDGDYRYVQKRIE